MSVPFNFDLEPISDWVSTYGAAPSSLSISDNESISSIGLEIDE